MSRPVAQQKVERHRLRKLRRALEASVDFVIALDHHAVRAVEQFSAEWTSAARLLRARGGHLHHGRRGAGAISGSRLIGVRYRGEYALERRHAVAVVIREIR